MTQPPTSGRGPGEEPARDSGSPGGSAAGDPRLAEFAEGGAGDVCAPGPELAAMVAELSGPEWRCAGATDDELLGLLGRWDAIGSWAEAGKLGVVRELLRRRAHQGLGGGPSMHGDLPDQWDEGTEHEVSAALRISLRSADNLTAFAWDLQARLPDIGAALANGTLTPLKARIISDELKVLDDEHAAHAEKLILDQLDGQTPAQLARLAAQVVCTVDPDGAAKRRERAEREEARVRFWRDNGGACALAAFGLPTDAALAANDAINDRAASYKAAKIRPAARMDQLRVLAFLDLLNGITFENRITQTAPRKPRRPAPTAMTVEPAKAHMAPLAVPAQTAPAAVTLPPAMSPVRAARVTVTVTAAPAPAQGSVRAAPAQAMAAAATSARGTTAPVAVTSPLVKTTVRAASAAEVVTAAPATEPVSAAPSTAIMRTATMTVTVAVSPAIQLTGPAAQAAPAARPRLPSCPR